MEPVESESTASSLVSPVVPSALIFFGCIVLVFHFFLVHHQEQRSVAKSKEFVDQIQEDLGSHDVPTLKNARERLAHVIYPIGSQYAMSISRRILDLLERKAIRFTDAHVRSTIFLTSLELENPEILECIDRVLAWPNDRADVLSALLYHVRPSDSTAAFIISRIRLIGPLSGERRCATFEIIREISKKFRHIFSRRQIDELLAYLLTPEALNAPLGPDGTVDYDFGFVTPAFEAFGPVNNQMHLSSANWKMIGNCFFQLNYTPVELVPLLYDKQPPQGVDVDALILACYEVACDFRHTSFASYRALRVLLGWQTEMDDRLLAMIATLIMGNLEAEPPARNPGILGYLRVRDASAALVDEVLRLQTGRLWNAPLLYALFDTFRVGAQIDFGPAVEKFRALLQFPAWPGELLRQHISEIVRLVFQSFTDSKVKQEFWTRLCREYPAPEMELLDPFSELVETGVVYFEMIDRAGRGYYNYDSWEAIETILSSRAYEAASPGPDSLFWQRLRAKIEPFLDTDDPRIRSRASAILAQSSS